MDAAVESREPVKLVVKSPNQQFEDHTVDCEPVWSIRKLKEHLSEVYPCKPTPDEQKLIYSGQLLKDQLVLKDVLRHYDDPQPQFHILHLVYTPKNQQNSRFSSVKSKNSNDILSNDGLRQRNVASNQSQEMQSQTANGASANLTNVPGVSNPASTNCPTSGLFGNGGNNIPGIGYPQQPNQYILAQQMAMQNWMQQAYIQYMNQYMSLLSEGMRPEAIFMQHQAQPQMPYPTSQNLPFSQPFFGQNLPGSPLPSQPAAPAAAATDAQIGSPSDVPANPPAPAVAAAAAAPQPAQAQNPQPQPRFPNLVQENPEENRDWLDIFYSMIRVMVLLTLVYFYSSAIRCAVVIFIGLAIYLYHIGFFRRRMQAREANNNNVAAAVENIQQQQQQQHNQGANGQLQENNRQNGEEAPVGLAANANREGTNDSTQLTSSSVPEIPEGNGNSVIAFVRTFVVSFFVSLLPEAPAL